MIEEEEESDVVAVAEPAVKVAAKAGAATEESEDEEEEEPDDEDVEASLDVILKERLVVEDEPEDEEATDQEDKAARAHGTGRPGSEVKVSGPGCGHVQVQGTLEVPFLVSILTFRNQHRKSCP